MAKLYKNPKTGAQETSEYWAKKYSYGSAKSFASYYGTCAREGRVADAFTPKSARQKRWLDSQLKRAKLYTNPTPNSKGELVSKTAKGWAKHLKMSESGWLDRVRKHGKDAVETYETRKQANERRKANMRVARSERTANVLTGPVAPIKKRRGNLAGIKIGSWEQKFVPDRWAHLVGEP